MPFRRQSDSSQFSVPRAGFNSWDMPSIRTFATTFPWRSIRRLGTRKGAAEGPALLDAYVSSWHIPWATVQVGQQRVWFNRALISSTRHLNLRGQPDCPECVRRKPKNSRDIGIAILSDEDRYKFNYAIGIWGGVGCKPRA